MAIVYTFKVNDPNNAGNWPPSVEASDWLASILTYFEKNSIGGSTLNPMIIFADQSNLDAFLAEYTLTDSALITDINSWKTAHGVSYSSAYYTLADANITPTPTPIIS